jgi:hypothetical protein
MRIVKTATYPICESCKEPITSRREGCIITGNLGVALIDEPNGIVGNNFPKTFKIGKDDVGIPFGHRPIELDAGILTSQVKQSALHWWCLLKMGGADLGEITMHWLETP